MVEFVTQTPREEILEIISHAKNGISTNGIIALCTTTPSATRQRVHRLQRAGVIARKKIGRESVWVMAGTEDTFCVLPPSMTSDKALSIIQLLKVERGISTRMLLKKFVPEYAIRVRRMLYRLQHQGVLVATKRGRDTYWRLAD